MIQVKRVYKPPATSDGTRFLVDRLWPRGVKKASLELEGWLKDVAPSDKLRKWFNHNASRWDAFQRLYFAELEEKTLKRVRSEEHTSELQSRGHLVCRLLLEKKKKLKVYVTK